MKTVRPKRRKKSRWWFIFDRKKEPQHHHTGSKPLMEKSHVHRSHAPGKAVADEEKQNRDPSWHSLAVSSKHMDL